MSPWSQKELSEKAGSVGVGPLSVGGHIVAEFWWKKKDIIAVYWQEIVLTLKANFSVPFVQFKANWLAGRQVDVRFDAIYCSSSDTE